VHTFISGLSKKIEPQSVTSKLIIVLCSSVEIPYLHVDSKALAQALCVSFRHSRLFSHHLRGERENGQKMKRRARIRIKVKSIEEGYFVPALRFNHRV
jgi:hypothetical protein